MATDYLSWSRYSDIPNGPDKKLFSVDAVYFVMINRWPELNGVLPRDIDGTEQYRDRVYEACTGIVKEAIEHLAREMREIAGDVENRFAAFLQNNNEINETTFNRMVENITKEFSVNGLFSCLNLLRYSACISLLAGHFYNHGVTAARQLATSFVHRGLPPHIFENSNYWDELAAAARLILGRVEAQ